MIRANSNTIWIEKNFGISCNDTTSELHKLFKEAFYELCTFSFRGPEASANLEIGKLDSDISIKKIGYRKDKKFYNFFAGKNMFVEAQSVQDFENDLQIVEPFGSEPAIGSHVVVYVYNDESHVGELKVGYVTNVDTVQVSFKLIIDEHQEENHISRALVAPITGDGFFGSFFNTRGVSTTIPATQKLELHFEKLIQICQKGPHRAEGLTVNYIRKFNRLIDPKSIWGKKSVENKLADLTDMAKQLEDTAKVDDPNCGAPPEYRVRILKNAASGVQVLIYRMRIAMKTTDIEDMDLALYSEDSLFRRLLIRFFTKYKNDTEMINLCYECYKHFSTMRKIEIEGDSYDPKQKENKCRPPLEEILIRYHRFQDLIQTPDNEDVTFGQVRDAVVKLFQDSHNTNIPEFEDGIVKQELEDLADQDCIANSEFEDFKTAIFKLSPKFHAKAMEAGKNKEFKYKFKTLRDEIIKIQENLSRYKKGTNTVIIEKLMDYKIGTSEDPIANIRDILKKLENKNEVEDLAVPLDAARKIRANLCRIKLMQKLKNVYNEDEDEKIVRDLLIELGEQNLSPDTDQEFCAQALAPNMFKQTCAENAFKLNNESCRVYSHIRIPYRKQTALYLIARSSKPVNLIKSEDVVPIIQSGQQGTIKEMFDKFNLKASSINKDLESILSAWEGNKIELTELEKCQCNVHFRKGSYNDVLKQYEHIGKLAFKDEQTRVNNVFKVRTKMLHAILMGKTYRDKVGLRKGKKGREIYETLWIMYLDMLLDKKEDGYLYKCYEKLREDAFQKKKYETDLNSYLATNVEMLFECIIFEYFAHSRLEPEGVEKIPKYMRDSILKENILTPGALIAVLGSLYYAHSNVKSPQKFIIAAAAGLSTVLAGRQIAMSPLVRGVLTPITKLFEKSTDDTESEEHTFITRKIDDFKEISQKLALIPFEKILKNMIKKRVIKNARAAMQDPALYPRLTDLEQLCKNRKFVWNEIDDIYNKSIEKVPKKDLFSIPSPKMPYAQILVNNSFLQVPPIAPSSP